MTNHMRLRWGLYWRTKYPPIPLKQIVLLFLLIALMTLASSLDYAIQRAEAAERAADIFGAQAKVLHDCERGASGYYYNDGRAFECSKRL